MTYQSKITGAVSALGLFFNPLAIQAEVIFSESSDLPQIIVTATRTAKTVDETLAPVTIITREDIERLQATSVAEVLRATPGISFTSNGGFGSVSGVSIRGSNTNHVLYLIDGVPIRSATSGTTQIQYIPIQQVERIEVVRGPRSSLYGSDAIGGVVQIFTIKGNKEQLTTSIGYGSDNTKELTASYANGDENSQFSTGFSLFETDGYNFLGTTGPDTDNDGYDNYSFSLNASHNINNKVKISGLYLRSQGKNQYDGYSYKDTHTDFTAQLVSGNINLDITENWNSQLKLSRNYDKQYFKSTQAGSITRFNTKTDIVSWQNDIIMRDTDLLTIGLDYKDDKVDSTTNYSEESRWNKAAFAQYQYEGDFFNTQVSYRYDDNEAFGSHNTWGIATGFSLDEIVRITTSYGTAFKAPTFNELYWPNYGNPDLKPEESKSFDFGVEITTGNLFWTANYFDTNIKNLIDYTTYVKNNQADIDGFELTVNTEFFGYTFSGNASFINPINKSNGKILPGRSKRNLNLSLDKVIGKFSYGSSIVASSERYNDAEEAERLSGFGLVNIRTAWQLNKQWTIKAKIDNLFDKQYVLTQTWFGDNYNQPDRFVFTSIHYEM